MPRKTINASDLHPEHKAAYERGGTAERPTHRLSPEERMLRDEDEENRKVVLDIMLEKTFTSLERGCLVAHLSMANPGLAIVDLVPYLRASKGTLRVNKLRAIAKLCPRKDCRGEDDSTRGSCAHGEGQRIVHLLLREGLERVERSRRGRIR